MTWYQRFKESVFFRKLFFLFFVTSLILFRTLLNRNLWQNPLSDVMGGWGIWETVNGEQKLTTECVENVIMMVPFSAVVMWTFEEKIGNIPLPDLPEQPENVQRPGSEVFEKGMLT